MKKGIVVLLTLFFLVGNLQAKPFANEAVVNIYVWSNYIPDWVIQQFETETGIRVNYSTYTNNEILYAKMKVNPDAEYDLIMPSTYFLERMIRQGMLQQLDFTKIDNYPKVDPFFTYSKGDPKTTFSMPYFWLATGIGVNTKEYDPKTLKKWSDLWSKTYRDQLLMLDDAREMFSISLLTLGLSVNTREKKEIELAYENLQSLMSNVKLFNSDSQKAIYLDEEINIGMAWSGDIFLVNQENPHVQMIYPEDGFVISVDSFAIPKSAKHVDNAHRFLNFLLRADVAQAICYESGFSCIDKNVVRKLPDTIKNSPILYPSADVLARGSFQEDVGEMATIYEQYFEKLKLGQ